MWFEIITQNLSLKRDVTQLLKTLLEILVSSAFKWENIYSWEYLVSIYNFKDNELDSTHSQLKCSSVKISLGSWWMMDANDSIQCFQ